MSRACWRCWRALPAARIHQDEAMMPPRLRRWIKTDCGRAQYARLAARRGPLARLRLAWFVLAAALRDLPLPPAA